MSKPRLAPRLLAIALLIALLGSWRDALAQDVQPTASPQGYRGADDLAGYRGDFADLATEIDVYWAEVFATAGRGADYIDPNIIVVDHTLQTPCGEIAPKPNAFYCPADATIYLVPGFLTDQEALIGDYAPVLILAHEWGHHVQRLLELSSGSGKARELQADCLAGAFTDRAESLGILEAGDLFEALQAAIGAGDAVRLPEDHPGAHGTAAERVEQLLAGWKSGPIAGCGLPLAQAAAPTFTPTPTTPPLISTATPTPSSTPRVVSPPTASSTSSRTPTLAPPTETPVPTATPTPPPPPTATLTPTPPPPTETPTPTPIPPTPTPTPNVDRPPPPAQDLLPAAPALAHAGCFFLFDEAVIDFPGLVARFADVPDASTRLSALGWRDGAFRQFGCDGPPPGTAGWIDVSVHVFGDDASAQAAVPYFAAARIAGTTLRYADTPMLGDATTAVTGPASNGWEYTLYASEGPVLVRVTGVAPAGDPAANVAAVTADVLEQVETALTRPAAVVLPTVAAPPTLPDASILGLLPDRLAIANAACFLPIGDWRFTAEEVVPWLGRAGAPPQLVESWDWQDGANRTLRCATPGASGASQFDVTVHRFGDVIAARAAEPYVLRGYAPGADEARRCGTAGDIVACVTGRGVAGPPTAAVEDVLRQVLAGV